MGEESSASSALACQPASLPALLHAPPSLVPEAWDGLGERVLLLLADLRALRVGGSAGAEGTAAAAPQALARVGAGHGVGAISIAAQRLHMRRSNGVRQILEKD